MLIKVGASIYECLSQTLIMDGKLIFLHIEMGASFEKTQSTCMGHLGHCNTKLYTADTVLSSVDFHVWFLLLVVKNSAEKCFVPLFPKGIEGETVCFLKEVKPVILVGTFIFCALRVALMEDDKPPSKYNKDF